MNFFYKVILTAPLLLTSVSEAQSLRTEGISRQVQALKSSLDNFSQNTRGEINNINEYLTSMRTCAIDGLAYVPGDEESDSRGCYRPIFTVEESIVSDLCIGSYGTETHDCNQCEGDVNDWKLVGSWDNDGNSGPGANLGVSYSSVSDTTPTPNNHWMINLCAKRERANIEVGRRFFSDLCLSTYNTETHSCSQCDGNSSNWKLVGSWDNDGDSGPGANLGVSYSSLADTSPSNNHHWMVNLCARIDTAGN